MIFRFQMCITDVEPVTSLLDSAMTPEMILDSIIGEFGLEILEEMPARFYCNCGKERVEKALISIGKKEIQDMIEDGKTIEVNCHFCNKNYAFTVDELKGLLEKAVR